MFENGAAGSAIMYSERIVFRRNRFLHNRGFASVGLLLQQCDDVLAEHNLIADNARGIFLEGTNRVTFRRQRRRAVRRRDRAVRLGHAAPGSRATRSSATCRRSTWSGKRERRSYSCGNYWSENREPDLDGDGRSDRPYRLSSVFDHFRGNLTAADLFADGFAAVGAGGGRAGVSRAGARGGASTARRWPARPRSTDVPTDRGASAAALDAP